MMQRKDHKLDPRLLAAWLDRLPENGKGETVLLYGPADADTVNAVERRNFAVSRFLPTAYQARLAGPETTVCDVERNSIPLIADHVVSTMTNLEFRNPLRVLEDMAAKARVSFAMVLQEPAAVGRWGFDPGVALHSVLKRIPGMFLVPTGRRHGIDQAFALTTPLVRSFLKSMRQDFASVDIANVADSRLLFARKRRIGRLHILAGVNAVGKSTMLDGLRAGRHPQLARDLGIDPDDPWTFTTYAHLLKNGEQADYSHLLVQYNITSPAVHGSIHGHHHGLLDLINVAGHTHISTMWLPHTLQKERYFSDRIPTALFSPDLYERRKSAKLRDKGGAEGAKPERSNPLYFRSHYARRKAERLLGIYADEEAFAVMYREWMAFAEANSNSVHVIFQEPEYRAGTIADWKARADQSP